MRSARRLGGAVLLVTLAASCDTTPPLLLESQTASLRISAPGAVAQKLDVWDTFEDMNSDGIHDPDVEGAAFLYCEQALIADVPVFSDANSVPWPFFIRVSTVREGQTEREDLTSALAATEAAFNLSEYDDSQEAAPRADPRTMPTLNTFAIVSDGGMERRFAFRNPRRLTRLNRSVILGINSPLCDVLDANQPQVPHTPACTLLSGRCSDILPQEASIDGLDQPFEIELGKGDLIRVEVRRAGTPQMQLGPLIVGTPGLNAALFIGGRRVNVVGDSSLDSTPGDSFAFTYTSR